MKKDITTKETIKTITEDIAKYILQLNVKDIEFVDKELTRDDEHRLGKYMLILETLSTNRDLKEKLKEAEEMLRDIKYEDLPSYEIGMEKGMERGMERGFSKGVTQGKIDGVIDTAITMITKFKLSAEDVAKELNISIDELKKHLNSK